jgi:hypothetical protein
MQAAPPTTAVDRALAQERTYTRTATVATEPATPPVARPTMIRRSRARR